MIRRPQLFYATSTGFSGEGRVECYNEYGGLYKGEFAAKTWVVDETVARTVAERSCPSCLTDIWVEGTGGPTAPGHCYRSRVSGSSPWKYQEGGSGAKCAPAAQPPPGGGGSCTPTETNPCSGPGGGYNYQDCGYYYGDYTGCTSPIVINLATGPYDLTGPLNSVTFDLDLMEPPTLSPGQRRIPASHFLLSIATTTAASTMAENCSGTTPVSPAVRRRRTASMPWQSST